MRPPEFGAPCLSAPPPDERTPRDECAPACALVRAQVKSSDSKTTLLHYLAKFVSGKSKTAIDDLRAQLNALPEAKDIQLADKKAEIAKLGASFKLAKAQLEAGKREGDSLKSLLSAFCKTAAPQLEQLDAEYASAETKLKELAGWLAEKPAATSSELFGPLSDFVKAVDKAAQDNAREEEAERRKVLKAANPGSTSKPGAPRPGMGMPGMGMPPPGIGGNNVMLEMQMKLAKRTERAAEGAGVDTISAKLQQQQLLAKQAIGSSKSKDGNVVDDLSSGVVSGALFAQRRAAAREAAMGGK